ncbi:MAG: leucine-rich repeat protein, partial [Malacoplasma sp.]|nr:leucine-rich repeat protein [Malacoplasma sp.]
SLGVLATAAPIVVTSCSKQPEREEVPYKSTVLSNTVEINVMSNAAEANEATFECVFFDELGKPIVASVKWELELPDLTASDRISINLSNGKLTVKVNDWSNLSEIKEYAVKVKGQSAVTTLSDTRLGTKEVMIRVIPYNKNIVKYDGTQYELKSNIEDITIFQSIVENTTTFPKNDGTDLLIEDVTKIESVSLQSVSSEWDKTIGNGFLDNKTNTKHLSNLSFVDISGLKDATEIGDYFLEWTKIKNFDGSIFTELESIGSYAFKSCFELESVTFKDNEKLITVGDMFCTKCYALPHIDISGWTNVEYIGSEFMSSCYVLEDINLNALSNLNKTGGDYENTPILQEAFIFCYGLERIIWNKDTELKQIDAQFCEDCASLEEIDFSGLKNVKTIADDFLNGCAKLSKLDLRSLTSLSNIGDSLLDQCPILKEIWLPAEEGTNIPILTSWGAQLYSLKTIHCGVKLDSYKNAAQWSDYSDLMVE